MLLGAHESIAGGISKAVERAVEHGGECLQVFTRSARGWSAPPLDEDERRAFRAASRRASLPAIAHGSYLVNLASEDPALRERSIRATYDELERCTRLGIPWLVIHPGAHPDETKGVGLIARALDEVLSSERRAARICLEVTAGQGASIGWRFEHLAEILARARREGRLGVCLDTCHLFAAGHDLSTPEGYEQTMSRFDELVGLSRVKCLHLNDCRKPLGCRVDRHAELGEGTIGLSAFRRLVNDPRFAESIGVLETPDPGRYGQSIRLLDSMRRQ